MASPLDEAEYLKLQSLKVHFKVLDTNNDGTLSFDELKQLFVELHADFTERQYQDIFSRFDKNGDGRVDIEEFLNFLFIDPCCTWVDGEEKGTLVASMKPRPLPDDWNDTPSYDCNDPKDEASWQQAVVLAHNEKRLRHGADRLSWSDKLYEKAKAQANACQEQGRLCRTMEDPCTCENIYWSPSPGASVLEVVQKWYDESHSYDFSNTSRPRNWKSTANFTQMIWKQTHQVGMAVSDDGHYFVCRYESGGNLSFKGAYGWHLSPVGTPPPEDVVIPGYYRSRNDGTPDPASNISHPYELGTHDYKFQNSLKMVKAKG